MGRPPIGDRAMTAAEKQRRYRARLAATKPPKPTADSISEAELAEEDDELEWTLRKDDGDKEIVAKIVDTVGPARARRIGKKMAQLVERQAGRARRSAAAKKGIDEPPDPKSGGKDPSRVAKGARPGRRRLGSASDRESPGRPRNLVGPK
jgi:hypothetical protein